jgi:hypothetical protein
VFQSFFDIDCKIFVCFSIESELTSQFEKLQKFEGIEARIGILCLEQFFIGPASQFFSNIFLSFRDLGFLKIVNLRNFRRFFLGFLFHFLGLKHDLLKLKFKGLAD